jgi:hypothetical protein
MSEAAAAPVTFVPLEHTVGRPLSWRRRSAFSRAATLVDADGQVCASLVGSGVFRISAVFAAAAGTWSLREAGWFGRRVEVFSEGSDEPAATYRAGWFDRGTLELPDGTALDWRSESWAGLRHAFFDAAGEPLVRMQARIVRADTVTIEREAPAVTLALAVAVAQMVTILRRRRRAH